MKTQLTPLSISVLPETEDATKLMAAREGKTLSAFVRELLEDLTETGGRHSHGPKHA